MSTPPQGFFSPLQQTRYNFQLVALGVSYMTLLRFGVVLTTRRLRGTDGLAAICMLLWFMYLTAQAVDVWNRTVYGVPVTNWYWVTNSVTLCYSAVLSGIVYMAALRLIKLISVELGSWWQKFFEWASLGFVTAVFVVRLARTVLIFMVSASNSGTNPSLSQGSTNLQLATFLPSLLVKCIMDAIAMYKLYSARAKYIVSAGREAFYHIVNTLIIEVLLVILASVVAFQEALNYPSWKLSFFDWMLFSWCLASWIDQRKQFAAIFGSSMSSRGTDSEACVTSQTKTTGSINDASKTVIARQTSQKKAAADDV